MALEETSYEVAAGQPVAISASSDTLSFLLNATSRTVSVPGLVAAPNRASDQILLAASLLTKPGQYTATITATSSTGAQEQATVSVTVKPRLTVPSGSTRPPVVLLNGWEEGYTDSCPVSSSSSDTFGNLAQYLTEDGVPAVYFFDNCAEGPNALIETLGNTLGTFLNSITYDNGEQVPQIDLVAFSIGGLIARSYLSGLQTTAALTPPATTLVRDLVLIATPNFGSFVATNYAADILTSSQSGEIINGSAFLWNLATWNQHLDDLRGVNAIAIIGNAGTYISDATGVELTNASDGIVSTTSASLGFVNQNTTSGVANVSTTNTRIVPYCQVDPSAFTNTTLGTYECDAPGIANITSTEHPTSEIVRSFLAGTTDWESIGTTPPNDPLLSIDGGAFFGVLNENDDYVSDLTQVLWGTLYLQVGEDAGTIFFDDFVAGTGAYTAVSSSLGSIDCGTVTQAVGYFAASLCKIDAAIISVGPMVSGSAILINAGATITITGAGFGSQCTGCIVTATPAGATTGVSLPVSSWTSTSITAQLPSTLSGLVVISVLAYGTSDNINIMVAPAAVATISATPASLQFTATAGGANPAAQSVSITNTGSGTLSWTATASTSSGGSWLSVSPTSGTAPSTLSVSVSIAGLSAGTYDGTVQIASSGIATQYVAVTLVVTAAPAVLSVTPQTLSFQYAVGGTAPAAQTVSITNTGGGTLSWAASVNEFWLAVSASSGTAPSSLSVSVNPANLAAGTYTGSVAIAGAGASDSVAVTLVVTGTQAAPAVTGVANAGSFQQNVASAAWVAIFGTNLSATTYTWQSSDFVNGQLPTSLHGVSVTINGIAAYVEYISPTQINVLAPTDSTIGSVPVVVTTAGQASNSVTVPEQQYSPALFTIANGVYAVAQHTNYALVAPVGEFAGVTSTPAQPGETILIYATGFGPTSPAVATGSLVTTPEPLANPVQFTIGGIAADVTFAGLVESGLYQFNVTVPAGLPTGNAAVVATIGGVRTQTGVSVPIQ